MLVYVSHTEGRTNMLVRVERDLDRYGNRGRKGFYFGIKLAACAGFYFGRFRSLLFYAIMLFLRTCTYSPPPHESREQKNHVNRTRTT